MGGQSSQTRIVPDPAEMDCGGRGHFEFRTAMPGGPKPEIASTVRLFLPGSAPGPGVSNAPFSFPG